MTEVTVARLQLRAPAGTASRTQARVEEALRLAASDDGRLVVLRALDLGLMTARAASAEWSARAGTRIAAVMERAVHGSTPGAERAEAIWFASEDEARALLLAELAAGRGTQAWFWRLALPDWRGASLASWLPRLMAQAARDPERLLALARVVTAMVEAGRLDVLVAALHDAPVPVEWRSSGSRLSTTCLRDSSRVDAHAGPEQGNAPLLARLSPALRRACIALVEGKEADRAAVELVMRSALVSRMPELASSPAMPAKVERLRGEAVMAAGTHRPSSGNDQAPPANLAERDPHARALPVKRTAVPHPSTILRETTSAPGQEDESTDAPAPLFHIERASAAAGLWLLIRPLARMGLGEWLEARPELSGFARALLRHIAERQRVAPHDPLFALLPAPDQPADPALLTAWRVGLDRWLRRRTRRKLARLVARRGWLTPQETGLRVRFRVDQADIALRLRALDVDPGWVPWLGLGVAYDYRDEPQR